ncbi:hypothetical protein GF324_07145 [bacterium]|nr:hypothetical protein [bacterium]
MKHAGIIAGILLLTLAASAQNLRELEWEELNAGSFIVTNPNQSVLIVESTLQGLGFESNRGIQSVEEPDPGVYFVKLDPGVQLITVRADGYLPLQLPRYNYQANGARKIRVKPEQVLGAMNVFDVSRPELILTYSPPDPTIPVYVQLGDAPRNVWTSPADRSPYVPVVVSTKCVCLPADSRGRRR